MGKEKSDRGEITEDTVAISVRYIGHYKTFDFC